MLTLSQILNLISRLDTQTGQDMARATRFDTRIALHVAETTMLDSAAMKALALVALIFLPGNFVAALLSTDFFKWDDTEDTDAMPKSVLDVTYLPQFGFFWVITVPLTGAIILLYAGWWWRRKVQWRRVLGEIEAKETRASVPGVDTGPYGSFNI